MKLILSVILLTISFGIASAQSTNTSTTTKTEPRKNCYVDADKNNVCDNYEKGTCKTGDGKCVVSTKSESTSHSCGNTSSKSSCAAATKKDDKSCCNSKNKDNHKNCGGTGK